MIKLICLDVDGTLLSHYTYLPQENLDSIKKALDKGVISTIVSGRISQSSRYYMNIIGQTGALSSLGGCVLEDPDGNIIEEFQIEKDVAEKAIELSEKLGITLLFYHHKNWYVDGNADGKWLESENKATGVEGITVPSLHSLLERFLPNKFLAIGEDHKKLSLFKDELDSFAGPRITTYNSTPDFLEVVPPSASKGQAVKSLCKYYGFSKDEVMAIGDYDNDISMLDASGIAVAVANASENLKKHATYITEANCEHAAVAEAINRFVLD